MTLIDDKGALQTNNGIVVHDAKTYYTLDEVRAIISKSTAAKRLVYGWQVRFIEGGQIKELFLREHDENRDLRTSGKESLEGWVSRLYERRNQ